MSLLFPDSLGQQGQSREPGADTRLLQHLPSACFLLAAVLQPGLCRSDSVPCPLAPESSHTTSCCLQGPPAALRSLLFWNVLISHACGLLLPFCSSGRLCDCVLPT